MLRKFYTLRLAAGLRPGCFFVCINCLPLRRLKYGKGYDMSNIVFDSGFIRAFRLRMCLGFVFVGLAVAAHTAQSAEGSFTPGLEILSIQLVRSDADWLNTNVALTRSENNAQVWSGISNTSRLYLVAEPKKEAVWSANARWQITPDNGRASLSPLLRFESKGGRIDIKPRRHSVWFEWRKALPF